MRARAVTMRAITRARAGRVGINRRWKGIVRVKYTRIEIALTASIDRPLKSIRRNRTEWDIVPIAYKTRLRFVPETVLINADSLQRDIGPLQIRERKPLAVLN